MKEIDAIKFCSDVLQSFELYNILWENLEMKNCNDPYLSRGLKVRTGSLLMLAKLW